MSRTLKYLMEGLGYSMYRQPEGMSSDDIMGMDIPAVVSDERRLSDGCPFICCPITNHNGAHCINKAITTPEGDISPDRYSAAGHILCRQTRTLSGKHSG